MGYLERQDCDKPGNLCDANGLKFLNIEKIIFATAKIIFSMSSVCYDVITGKSPISGVSETDSHVDFVDFLEIGGFNFDFLG